MNNENLFNELKEIGLTDEHASEVVALATEYFFKDVNWLNNAIEDYKFIIYHNKLDYEAELNAYKDGCIDSVKHLYDVCKTKFSDEELDVLLNAINDMGIRGCK